MTLKQNLAEQLKAQSDIWRAQAKDYQERLEQAGEQARAEYKKAMEQMEAKIQDAAKLSEQVRSAQRSGVEGHGHRQPEGICGASAGLGGGCVPISVIRGT
jgi:hypothetical protein